jgi:hypothetical protein
MGWARWAGAQLAWERGWREIVVSPVVRLLSGRFVFFAGDKLQVIDFGALASVNKFDNIGTDGAGRYLSHV